MYTASANPGLCRPLPAKRIGVQHKQIWLRCIDQNLNWVATLGDEQAPQGIARGLFFDKRARSS